MLTWEKIPQLLSRIGPFQIEHPVAILQDHDVASKELAKKGNQ